MLEEWVQCYLLLTRKAAPFVHDLMKGEPLYFGVVKFPLRLIQRNGNDIVANLAGESHDDVFKASPLLIQYEEGKFFCTAQQVLLASLKQSKINAYPTIIVLKGNTEYRRFMKYYGNIFIYVDKI